MNNEWIIEGLITYFQENGYTITLPEERTEWKDYHFHVNNDNFTIKLGNEIQTFQFNCQITIHTNGTILLRYPFILSDIELKSKWEIYESINHFHQRILLSRIYYKEDVSEFCAEYLWQTFDPSQLTQILQILRLEIDAFANNI